MNTDKPCDVPSCSKRRWHTSAQCKAHAKRLALYAHPEQRGLPKEMIHDALHVVSPFLHQGDMRTKLREDVPTLRPALDALGLLLDPSRVPAEHRAIKEALAALQRPTIRKDAKTRRPAVTPLEALRLVLAVAHVETIRPSLFLPHPEGSVFWRQAAHAVLRSRMRVDRKQRLDGTMKRERPVTSEGLDWFTGYLRAACTPVIAAWQMDRTAQENAQQAAWQAEREKHEEPAPVVPSDDYPTRLAAWRKELDGARGNYDKRLALMARMPQPLKEVTEPPMDQYPGRVAPWQIGRQVTPNYIPEGHGKETDQEGD